METLIIRQSISNIAEYRFLECFRFLFTFFRIKLIPVSETSHNTNAEAIGNAARWQGYAAREGFGITLIKNHNTAKTPAT